MQGSRGEEDSGCDGCNVLGEEEDCGCDGCKDLGGEEDYGCDGCKVLEERKTADAMDIRF